MPEPYPVGVPDAVFHGRECGDGRAVPSGRITSKENLGFGGRGYCAAVCAGCGAATPIVLSPIVKAEVEHVWRRMNR
jgi:hypothetical protein